MNFVILIVNLKLLCFGRSAARAKKKSQGFIQRHTKSTQLLLTFQSITCVQITMTNMTVCLLNSSTILTKFSL